jgi:3-hydroxybutyryl-CoA dehydrogenase
MAEKIGVIGAGTIGSSVALNLSCFNYEVYLIDVSKDALSKSNAKIAEDFRMLKMFKKEFNSLNIENVLDNIHFSENYDCLAKVDIVIENVTEAWEVKKELIERIKTICKKEALFWINTSCISITKIAALLPFPERVIGMHFMNPVPLKDAVEVIKGFRTSDSTLEASINFLKSLKKIPIVVNDMPGFVANRLSHLFMNEAAFLVQEQVASPKDIDMIFKKGYGHSMGPLETADLIGLDTVVNSLDVLYFSYNDPKFRCCPLLKKMVDAGLLGKKSGEGFYKY